jgi:hypothetical protein
MDPAMPAVAGQLEEIEFSLKDVTWRILPYCGGGDGGAEHTFPWVFDAQKGEISLDLSSVGESSDFPYRDITITEWDCDEVLFNVSLSDAGDWSFRGFSAGRLCIDYLACQVQTCEDLDWDTQTNCPAE